MKTRFSSAFIALFIVTAPSFADPVEFDTDQAHVTVIRPIDSWAPNPRVADYTLNCLKGKNTAFYYYDNNEQKILGTPRSLDKFEANSLPHQAQAKLLELGVRTRGSDSCALIFEVTSTVDQKEMPEILGAQDALRRELIARQGNPATIPDRIKSTNYLNAAMSFALLGVGMSKLGAVSGSQFVFSTGISEDIAKLTLSGKKALVPVRVPPFDYRDYQSIDIRKIVGAQGQIGQLIIAYKTTKTPELENELFARAIVSASGADTTIESVIASRANDLIDRQKIWDTCVSEGKCKND